MICSRACFLKKGNRGSGQASEEFIDGLLRHVVRTYKGNFAVEAHGRWNTKFHITFGIAVDYLSKAMNTTSIVVNSCNCRLKPSTCLACETRRCRRRLCRVDCHNMINQMRLAMTTVRSPSPTVATAASREQTSSRVYCNVRLPWQPACSPLPKQRRNENILLSSHPSPPHLFLITPPPSLSFFF